MSAPGSTLAVNSFPAFLTMLLQLIMLIVNFSSIDALSSVNQNSIVIPSLVATKSISMLKSRRSPVVESTKAIAASRCCDSLQPLKLRNLSHHLSVPSLSVLPLRSQASHDDSAVVTKTDVVTDSSNDNNKDDKPPYRSIWERAALSILTGDPEFSTSNSSSSSSFLEWDDPNLLKQYVQLVTLLRIGIPAALAGILARIIYPTIAMMIASIIDDPDVFAVISQDSSQYIQNILTTCGLTFSILVGQTYYFMYQQQESIYYALFHEVTIAKSLLEQVALVCQGRDVMYRNVLNYISQYVQNDLKQLQSDPAILLSSRPVDDPLESVMYVTSVGVPGVVYDTVRSLRQARARRLGALQRKLPQLHMVLLWSLAAVVLSTFPLLGSGAQTIGGYNILIVQGTYLAFIVFGIFTVMGVINELRKPAGGAYNVDSVLRVMVMGMEEELQSRLNGTYNSMTKRVGPTVDSSLARSTRSSLDAITAEVVTDIDDDDDDEDEDGLLRSSKAVALLVDETSSSTSSGMTTEGSEEKSSTTTRPWFGERLVRRIRRRHNRNIL